MTEPAKTTEANKALARRWFAEGWSLGHLEVADEIFAADFSLRGRCVGPDGPKRSVAARRHAFDSLTVEVRLQVAEGDWVCTYFTARGRHIGEYSGVAPTGREITGSGVVIWRVRDGQAVEDWNVFDRWDVVSQIDPTLGRRPLFLSATTDSSLAH